MGTPDAGEWPRRRGESGDRNIGMVVRVMGMMIMEVIMMITIMTVNDNDEVGNVNDHDNENKNNGINNVVNNEKQETAIIQIKIDMIITGKKGR